MKKIIIPIAGLLILASLIYILSREQEDVAETNNKEIEVSTDVPIEELSDWDLYKEELRNNRRTFEMFDDTYRDGKEASFQVQVKVPDDAKVDFYKVGYNSNFSITYKGDTLFFAQGDGLNYTYGISTYKELVNLNGNGFYRIQYTKDNFKYDAGYTERIEYSEACTTNLEPGVSSVPAPCSYEGFMDIYTYCTSTSGEFKYCDEMMMGMEVTNMQY